jgi:hypothetical protein
MKQADSLVFELSPEQVIVLTDRATHSDSDRTETETETSYRAWNAAFVSCDAPMELSYRAWNAAFVCCESEI